MQATSSIFERLAQVPLVQAPMAGVSTPELAAAVSNAGAIGSIGIGAASLGQARQMVRDTRALTSAPFNVNVFCHQPGQADPAREAAWLAHLSPLFAEFGAKPPAQLNEIYKTFVEDDAALHLLLSEKPAIVSFHFGLPATDRIRGLQNAGICTFATATSLDEARRIEDAGVDAIVAQGIEAGGHRGMFDPDAGTDDALPLAVLVRLLVRQTKLPVIAAGGIMDGQGIRAALALGATAAQLGTAFILCPESSASGAYRALLRSEQAFHTQLTSALSGRPARGIVNRLFTHGSAAGSPRAAGYPMAYDAAKQLHALAARAGNDAFGAHWAGQGAPLARALPAAEMVRTLLAEAGC